jgi:hypothetical protein
MVVKKLFKRPSILSPAVKNNNLPNATEGGKSIKNLLKWSLEEINSQDEGSGSPRNRLNKQIIKQIAEAKEVRNCLNQSIDLLRLDLKASEPPPPP